MQLNNILIILLLTLSLVSQNAIRAASDQHLRDRVDDIGHKLAAATAKILKSLEPWTNPDPFVVQTAIRHWKTPLNWAIARGQIAEAQALVEAGADINETSLYGETALHVAIMHCPEIAQFLIDHGIDTTKRITSDSFAGKNAYDLAIIYSKEKIIAMLESASAIDSDCTTRLE